MKKTLIITILLVFICFSATASAYQLYENKAQIVLNDSPISFNVSPLTLNDRTLVPMRKIFESLGANVQWKAETRSVIAQKGEDIIVLSIDSNTAIVNNNPVLLDAPAILYESSTMVPLRFIAEHFNLNVEFVKETNKIIITDVYDPYDIEELKKQENYQEISYDDFIYYGGTKNNKPHGLGKVVTKNGITLFEGNFVNNVWSGFGKLYYDDGSIQYSGNFENNQFNGFGNLYSPNGTLTYTGYFQNDKPHGNGISYYENGVVFVEGVFSNGLVNGYGKAYREDGTLGYEGNFVNDLPYGQGIYYYSNGNKSTEGTFKEGALLEGEGIEYYENGNKAYEGDFHNGVYHGVGTTYTEDGKRIGTYEFNDGEQGERLIAFTLEDDGKTPKQYYFGDFIYMGEVNEEEIPDGCGIMYYKSIDNLYYSGDFVDGRIEGYGMEYHESGSLLYEGEFLNGTANGYGKLYFENGNIGYEGEFRNGQKNGYGKLYYENGVLGYEGEFRNNQMSGSGILYDKSGYLAYAGNFVDGSPVDNYDYSDNYSYSYTPLTPISSTDLYLFANDGTGTFLGNLNTNKNDIDSITNGYGNYGSKYSQTSIFNTYGTYGSKYSQYSAFNPYATNPPKIVDGNGKFIGYLTANKYLANAISYEELIIYLNR